MAAARCSSNMRHAITVIAALACASSSLAQTNTAPEWAKEAVFYQIFPERFRNGDPANDPTRDSLEQPVRPGPDWRISAWTADWYARDDWEKELGSDFYKDGVFDRRYGGDLKGVLDKLDYLSELGINAIYFNPVFYSRSLHKYDGNSYHHIDPYFGPDPKGDFALIGSETSDPATWKWTAADKLFLDLVKQCHARGIKVIIDGVFNHTGRDFFAFKDIRENQAKSRYKDWYKIDSFDDPRTKRNEFSYHGWWGTKTLPEFAASKDGKDMHPGPKAYIMEATRRWMKPNGKVEDGIDGWRLDVADMRPAKFWSDWHQLVRQLNPNAYTTSEVWKNAAEFVAKAGFSASMNYNAFTIPVKAFLMDDGIPASRFAKLLDQRRKDFPAATAAVMQNLVDSHDTDRMPSMIVNSGAQTYNKVDDSEFNNQTNARASSTYDIRKPKEKQRQIQRLVVLFQMVYVGAPMIYYGDEAGMWGGNDPDDRMPMVWPDMTYDPQAIDPRGHERGPDEVKFDDELFQFYRRAIALRREHDALNHGEYTLLVADDAQHALALSRRSAKEALVIAFNRGEEPATLQLHVPAAKLRQIFVTDEGGTAETRPSEAGAEIVIPPLTGVAFAYE